MILEGNIESESHLLLRSSPWNCSGNCLASAISVSFLTILRWNYSARPETHQKNPEINVQSCSVLVSKPVGCQATDSWGVLPPRAIWAHSFISWTQDKFGSGQAHQRKKHAKTNENQPWGILDSCKTSTAKSVIDDTVAHESKSKKDLIDVTSRHLLD